jgi:hypothetical protein
MAKNSSRVIADRPAKLSEESYSSRSVTIEPIDNGYLTTVCECRDGEYHSTKTYSRDKPELEQSTASERRETTNSLRDAIAAVKGR